MKQIYLMGALCMICFSAGAQTKQGHLPGNATGKNTINKLSISNTSGVPVQYWLYASDAGACDGKYRINGTVGPNSKVTVDPTDRKIWAGDIPKPEFHFTSLSAEVNDPSGDCSTLASNPIGSSGCGKTQSAAILSSKCIAGSADVSLQWNDVNGTTSVMIK